MGDNFTKIGDLVPEGFRENIAAANHTPGLGEQQQTQPAVGVGTLGKPITERMLKWFEYEHLPANLRGVSQPFGELAAAIAEDIEPGPERTVALRKLLEAKDAAVRAKLHPGG